MRAGERVGQLINRDRLDGRTIAPIDSHGMRVGEVEVGEGTVNLHLTVRGIIARLVVVGIECRDLWAVVRPVDRNHQRRG